MGQPHKAGLGYREPTARQSSPGMQQKIPWSNSEGKPSSTLGEGRGFRSRTDCVTYPQKPLQEFPGAVDVDAGDVAVAPQHAIHRGRHILPVLLCLGVKLTLVLHHLAGHAGRGHVPVQDSLLPWDGRTPKQ